MGTRTVRLDAETEAALKEIQEATGLPISTALKKGLLVLRRELAEKQQRTPFEIYRELELGKGGWSIGASTETRRLVRTAIAKKLRR
jgi:hypothetical protein